MLDSLFSNSSIIPSVGAENSLSQALLQFKVIYKQEFLVRVGVESNRLGIDGSGVKIASHLYDLVFS